MKKTFVPYAFFTTGSFGKIIINKLIESSPLKPSIIITTNQKHLKINRRKVPFVEISELKKQNTINQLKAIFDKFQVQTAVLSDFGLIIPPELLSYPKYGFLNIHPSLLPRWRGATPIQSAIVEGDTYTGVTIILMNSNIDEGNIIIQSQPINILESDTYVTLQTKLAKLSCKLLVKALAQWVKGLIKAKPQSKIGITTCRKLKKTDGQIIWSKHNASQISRMIRAYYPFPTVYAFINKKGSMVRVQIWEAKKVANNIFKNLTPGSTYLTSEKRLFVSCANNSYLELLKVKPEGKKIMPIKAFINGYQPYLKCFY